MADIKVELVQCPTLPNTIQGDGRYVMSLLKSYLEQIATQVDLANGFSAEEIDPTTGDYVTPRNFKLTFSMLGGEFTWTHLTDLSNFAFYELRTDKNVGEQAGLLERTVNNSSTVMSTLRVDTIYLYAVSQDAKYSNPSVLNYNKPYPNSPGELSITDTKEGVLITYEQIPTNCMGTNVYVNGIKYNTADNVYLYTGTDAIKQVEVAFYDQFGEGERTALYVVLPTVTGFLVERNGSELDFYWDKMNVYGIKYLVKAAQLPDWEQGVELFRTDANGKNRYLFPNQGTYYFMIKAYTDNGAYSDDAAYVIVGNEPSIDRNVILEYDQGKTLYSGHKINVYYKEESDGIVLDNDAIRGEYSFDVHLDQEYRARNWLDYNATAITDSSITWDDANISWDDIKLYWAGVVGDIDSTSFRHEIAYATTEPETGLLFSANLNGAVDPQTAATITENQSTSDYALARWQNGLMMGDLTRLAYKTSLQETFNMTFWLKLTQKLGDTILVSLTDDSGNAMVLGYDSKAAEFYLRCTDGQTLTIPMITADNREFYYFGISQGTSKRTLYIQKYSTDETFSDSTSAAPVGTFGNIYCYPEIAI